MCRDVLPLMEPGGGVQRLFLVRLVLRLIDVVTNLCAEVVVHPTRLLQKKVLLDHGGVHEGEHIQEHSGFYGDGGDAVLQPLAAAATLSFNGDGIAAGSAAADAAASRIFSALLKVCNGFFRPLC